MLSLSRDFLYKDSKVKLLLNINVIEELVLHWFVFLWKVLRATKTKKLSSLTRDDSLTNDVVMRYNTHATLQATKFQVFFSMIRGILFTIKEHASGKVKFSLKSCVIWVINRHQEKSDFVS